MKPYEGAPESGLVQLSALVGDQWTSKFLRPDEFAEAAQKLEGKQDIYFGPALRARPSGERQAVLGSRVVWVDFDEPAYPSPGPLLPPTWVVSSGRGWHLYWVLSSWIETDQIEYLNKILVGVLPGADPACWNANRLLRLPDTVHSGTGKRVHLSLSRLYEYSPRDVEALHSVDEKLHRKVTTGDSRGYASRSERDFAVVRDLKRLEFSDAAIFAIFTEHEVGAKFREHRRPEHYLRLTLSRVERSGRAATEDLRRRDDGYYLVKGPAQRRLSTFTFEPHLLIEGELEDSLLGAIRTADHAWENIALSKTAFSSVRGLLKELPKASWQWLGNDQDVRNLLPHLMEELRSKGAPRVRAVAAVGRHGEYFVLPGMTLSATQTWKHPEGPVVFLRPGSVEVPEVVPHEAASFSARDALRDVLAVNLPTVMYPLLGWWLACPVKPMLEERGYRFPLLNVSGTRGSGKTTTLTEVLMRLYAYRNRTTFDSTTTRFVLLSLLGGSNALPVALSEFRQVGAAQHLMRYVLLSYDVGHDPRGRPDRTIEDYPLCAPFSLDGEDVLHEPAARERMIGVRLRPDTIAENSPHSAAFWKIYRSQDLEAFALPYLAYTLGADLDTLLRRAENLMIQAFPSALPHRVRRNFTVVTLGLVMAEDFAGLELPNLGEVLFDSLAMSYHPELGRGRLHVDELIESVVSEVEQGTTKFFWRYDDEANTLWFQLTPVLSWWIKDQRRGGRDSLGREAISSQLEEVVYAVEPQIVEDRWCYGVSLSRAAETGLDVPTHIDVGHIVINL